MVALALFVTAGLVAYFGNSSADGRISDELASAAQGATLQVDCSNCGKRIQMPADEYIEALRASGDGADAIQCPSCGESAAWRAPAPIEYSDKQWQAGAVGHNMLVSDLKAFHAANPRSEEYSEDEMEDSLTFHRTAKADDPS